MSLLGDLRLDIGDDVGVIASGVLIPASCSLLGDLRVDIADDTGATASGISISSGLDVVVNNLVVNNNLTVKGNSNLCGALYLKRRIITAAGPVTVTNSDNIVLLNKTVGASTIVTIPAPGASKARFIVIKDMKGDANINNITITPSSGTIDGFTSWVITQKSQAITLIDNGIEWNII